MRKIRRFLALICTMGLLISNTTTAYSASELIDNYHSDENHSDENKDSKPYISENANLILLEHGVEAEQGYEDDTVESSQLNNEQDDDNINDENFLEESISDKSNDNDIQDTPNMPDNKDTDNNGKTEADRKHSELFLEIIDVDYKDINDENITLEEKIYVSSYMNLNIDDIDSSDILYDINDKPSYIIVSYKNGGYAIMIRNNLIISESSFDGNDPYKDIVASKKYYLGVFNYYYQENETLYNVIEGTSFNYNYIDEYINLNNEYLNADTNKKIYISNDEVLQLNDDQNNDISFINNDVEEDTSEDSNPEDNISEESNLQDSTLQNEERYDDFLISSQASIISTKDVPYAEDLRQLPFGDNVDGTCGTIATEILLRYYDKYVKSGFVDSEYYSDEIRYDGLHQYLLKYRVQELVGGTFPNEDAFNLNYYLGAETSRSKLGYNAKWNLVSTDKIDSQINNGYPTTISTTLLTTPDVDRHVMVAYGYRLMDNNGIISKEYKVHTGWYSDINAGSIQETYISSILPYGGTMWLESYNTHEHSFENIHFGVDKTSKHYLSCGECELVKSEYHNFIDGLGYDNFLHQRYCKKCNYVSQSCSDGTVITDLGSYHRTVCKTCDYSINDTHKYNDYDVTSSTEHTVKCDVCDHKITENHTLEYTNKDTKHEITCSKCIYFNEASHEYSVWTNTFSNHTRFCVFCKKGESAEHRYSGWTVSGNTHYRTCKDCGHINTSSHTFANWKPAGSIFYSNYIEDTDIDLNDDVSLMVQQEHSMFDTENSIGNCEDTNCEDHTDIGEAISLDDIDDLPINSQLEIVAPYSTSGHSRSCTTCGYTESGNHNYILWTSLGSQHTATCSTCSYQATGNHTYSSYSSNGSTGHSQTCTVCGNRKDGAHNFSGWKDSGYNHTRNCTNCNYSESSSHDYGTWSYYTSLSHIRYCKQCNKSETQNHNLSSWSSNTSLNHTRRCNSCSYSESGSHSLGSWSTSSYSHSRSCRYCNYNEFSSHSFGSYSSSNSSNHKKTCYTCNYTESSSHNYGSWSSSIWGNTHERTCYTCRYTDKQNHNYGYWSSSYFGNTHERTCNTCRYTDKQNHRITTGWYWTSVGTASTCRKRENKCSDCSYSYYEYDYNHSIIFNSCSKCYYRR